jgi:hypothetical protein
MVQSTSPEKEYEFPGQASHIAEPACVLCVSAGHFVQAPDPESLCVPGLHSIQ